MVADLHHFLGLPAQTPGPARRLAEQLGNIVRAATAGDAGADWETALPCARRPTNHRCPGHTIVRRTEPPAPIRWQCSVCGDEGVISAEVAAVLRELRLFDADCERLVFGIRAHNDGAVLQATNDGLDELIGFVAGEANHESNRRRQQRLDAAFDALSSAAQAQ